MTYALVIGGTGMLSSTSLWLVSKGYHISVIGRNPNRMAQLKLGSIIENGHSRWLTNEGISQGVIDSIQNVKLINNIGTIKPWGKRPL